MAGALLLLGCSSSDGVLTKKKGGFFKRMTDGGMLERWDGMTVDEALSAKVDVVAGATYSSNAVAENVRLGLTYYKEHK